MALYHTVNGSPVEVKHINHNSSAVNYVIKDGKLVWADPRLALSGPVGYTVVGNPTIVDGIVNDIANSTDYIQTSTTLPSVINSFEMVIKGKTNPDNGRVSCAFSFKDGFYRYGGFNLAYRTKDATGGNILWRYKPMETSSSEDTGKITISATDVHATSRTDFFWLKCTMQPTVDNKFLYSFYDSLDGNTWYLLGSQEDTYQMTGDDMSTIKYVANPNNTSGNTTYPIRDLDLNETYIKVNGQLWFYGKNYATQNIAPVPSGYTYGTTTTSAIGYVDMRTQQFTAAPTGATIGRDE